MQLRGGCRAIGYATGHTHVSDVVFACSDFSSIGVAPGDVVYCDPPYKDTMRYKGVPTFHSDAFWTWCDEAVDLGAKVYVSEVQAPPHWTAVQHRTIKNTTCKNAKGGYNQRVESLWTRSG
jgi:DNA adenine methylase